MEDNKRMEILVRAIKHFLIEKAVDENILVATISEINKWKDLFSLYGM